jgi:dipeptidyl aminopeptidase/acylaminoacyl peptidase
MGLVRSSGSAFFAVSRTGTLAYVPAASMIRTNKGLAWVDRTGSIDPLPLEPKPFQSVRISPDFRRAALGYRLGPTDADVWTYDLERRLSSRLTSDDAWEGYPVWTPDGASLVFSSSRDGGSIFRQAANGAGAAEQLVSRSTPTGISSTSPLFPYAVSPEGRLTLYFSTDANGSDLFTMPLEAGAQVTPLVQTRFDERLPAVSPDGRWLAYRSNESGRYEIYVRAFPGVDASKVQISRAGGDRPEWAPNGRELFYVEGDALMSVPVTTGPRFEAGAPVKLFESRGRLFLPDGRYGVSRDAQRFLMLTNNPDDDHVVQRPEIRVILNWTEELKAKVP